jgi:hypothetical protein
MGSIQRILMSEKDSIALRKSGTQNLRDLRLRVFSTGGDLVGRVGIIMVVQTTFGSSTRHVVVFKGGGYQPGITDTILLRKDNGKVKGFSFQIMQNKNFESLRTTNETLPN